MSHDWSEKGEGKAEELREILSIVSDKVPNLLRGLRDILYSPEAAENMAGAVATFYRKLVEAGIPKEEAMDMAKGYMINLRELMGSKGINIGNFMDRHGEREED
jgi:hypothetical protein